MFLLYKLDPCNNIYKKRKKKRERKNNKSRVTNAGLKLTFIPTIVRKKVHLFALKIYSLSLHKKTSQEINKKKKKKKKNMLTFTAF